MSFNIEDFYTELDRRYQQRDQDALEEFLLSSKRSAQRLSQPGNPETSCPSCIEEPEPNLEFVSVCNELACFYRGLSRWEEAIAAFQEALGELRRFFLEKTPNAAMVLMNLADTQRLMGACDDALATFSQVEQILEKNNMTGGSPMAGLCNSIALVYQTIGQPETAISYMEKAVSILDDLPDNRMELGVTCSNLASAYSAVGRQAEADAVIEVSISLLSQADCAATPHYHAALNTRGVFAFQAGDYAKAAECFTASLEQINQIYGKSMEYAIGCRNCAEVFRRLGEQEKADRYQAEAEALTQKLAPKPAAEEA